MPNLLAQMAYLGVTFAGLLGTYISTLPQVVQGCGKQVLCQAPNLKVRILGISTGRVDADFRTSGSRPQTPYWHDSLLSLTPPTPQQLLLVPFLGVTGSLIMGIFKGEKAAKNKASQPFKRL